MASTFSTVVLTPLIGASAAKPHMDDTSAIFHIHIYILYVGPL